MPAPPPTGSVFPSLDGSTPGEQESPTNIDDIILPDLNPQPDITVNTRSHNAYPEGQKAPETPDAAATADVNLGVVDPPRGGKKRSIQDRFDALTRRHYDDQSEITKLTAQVRELAALLGRPAPGPAPAPAPVSSPAPVGDDPLRDLVAGTPGSAGTPQPAALDAASIAKIVKDTVSQAISSREQEVRQLSAAQEQLRQHQEQAFEAACEEFPELRDNRTRFRQAFNELFFNRKHPLSEQPDGPYQLAFLVRGLLADEAPAQRAPATDARKRQVSVPAPSAAPTDQLGAQTSALQKKLSELNQAMKNGDNSAQTYIAWRKVRAALQQR